MRRRLRLLTPVFAFSVVLTSGGTLAGWPAPQVAHAAAPPVTIATPELVRANGADLSWSRFALPAGATFLRYEVHRSATAGFTPTDDSTLVARFGSIDRTSFRDTTAAASPSATVLVAFDYRVVSVYAAAGVTERSVSASVRVTMAETGKARLTVQPPAAAGRASYVSGATSAPAAGCTTEAKNFGASATMTVGMNLTVRNRALVGFDLRRIPVGATVTSAKLSLQWTTPTTVSPGTISVFQGSRPWMEGAGAAAGACDGSGATYLEAKHGQRWKTAGADYTGAAAASVTATTRGPGTGTDVFDITGLAGRWVAGTAPNHGVVVRLATEATTVVNRFQYYTDDDATRRPKLEVLYNDPTSQPAKPRAALSSHGTGDRVTGQVTLTAAASDDGRVTKVEFLDGAAKIGEVTSSPYQTTWNSAAPTPNGPHDLTVRATDDAGNQSTSVTRVTVDNTGAPGVSLAGLPSTLSGTVSLSATASDDTGVAKVEFLVDGQRVGAADTTAPYQTSWNTTDQLAGLYDGQHTVTALATDISGQRTESPGQTVAVDNQPGGQFEAAFTLLDRYTGAVAGGADVAYPQALTQSIYTSAPLVPTDGSGGYPSLGDSPKDSTGALSLTATSSADLADGGNTAFTCPAKAYCPRIRVENTSPISWKGDKLQVWYRWYDPAGQVHFEGPATDIFPQTFQRGATKEFDLTIHPPQLPDGADLGDYRLRIDLYDTESGAWFGGRGNPPVDHPVLVAKDLEDRLGFEKFWTYEGEPTGAGSQAATNVANGNLLWRWTPWNAPGRGLATVLDLTYNSFEDHSDSPVGNNFSLAVSGLSRFGAPLDIHPNKADQISGRANKWIEFVDGDGTVHRFTGNADGSWTRPPGVHLHLRPVSSDPAAPRYWALSRPDNVTFYYDVNGFPTAVTDRSGNTIIFALQDTPSGEDPGGPKKRIVAVTDAGGRSFGIDYWSKAEDKRAHVRGKVQRITDHTGSALGFHYYDDGNLLRITQRGGASGTGGNLPDRSFTFTYTTSKGDAPAITAADPVAARAARRNPDPSMHDQSTRLFSIADPRAAQTDAETTFAYFQATDGAKLRWKLKSRTNRTGAQTLFEYLLASYTTKVKAPLGRTTTYTYDTAGKATKVVNAKGEATSYLWTSDFHVQKITEPDTTAVQTFTYNDAGYPTQQTNQENETTKLSYETRPLDATDTGQHFVLLSTVEQPIGVGSATAADYTWRFGYDPKGRVDRQTDPEDFTTVYTWNADGTLASVQDPRGSLTRFPSYDLNGLATSVVDAEGGTTRFGYTDDGLPEWTQTPIHEQYLDDGIDPRWFRTYTDHDAFHRPGRVSTPKSTATEPGRLVWTEKLYDLNNNVVSDGLPGYGTGAPAAASASDLTYDAMDRVLTVLNPDRHLTGGEKIVKAYDAAGRLEKETAPNGSATATVDDHTTSYTYDLVDRAIGTTRAGAAGDPPRTDWSCYDSVGNRTAAIQPKAGLTAPPTGCPYPTTTYTSKFEYDKAHRLTKVTDAAGRVTTQRYDDNGRVDQAVDETGSLSTMAYDERGLLVEQSRPLTATRRVTVRRQYDQNGNVLLDVGSRAVEKGTTTDYTTGYTYDRLNRPTRVALPKDATTEAAYEHMVYDADGRVKTKTLPLAAATLPADLGPNAKTTVSYFDPGWVAASQDPGNPEVLFDYTAQGWQSQRVPRSTPQPGSPPNDSLLMRWEYFDDGTAKARTDENGLPATYDYDRNNNLTRASAASGVVDPDERVVVTAMTYNGFDEVTRSGETKQLDTVASRVENYTTFGYDVNANLVARNDAGKAGAVVAAPKRNVFEYDTGGQLERQYELGTATTCTGDRRITTSWTNQGWLASRQIASATATCPAERDAAATSWTTTQTQTRTYLLTGDLDTSVTKNGSGTVKESHDVDYDQDGAYTGQRTRDVFRLEGPSAGKPCSTATCTATWTFDARDKLVAHNDGHGGAYTYKLDEPAAQADSLVRAGNVTTEIAPTGTTTRRYVGNQMTQTTVAGQTTTTVYDDLGRTDCIVKGTTATASSCLITGGVVPASLVTDYTYDYLDRLAATKTYNAGTLLDDTNYRYDALDRTVRQTEKHVRTGTETRTTDFAYLGPSDAVSSETASSVGSTTSTTAPNSKTVKAYSYDAYGDRFRMTDSAQTQNTDGTWGAATTTSATYSSDPHGSVSLLMHDSGTNVGKAKATYAYKPYGDADSGVSDGDTDKTKPFNPYRYTGKRFDSGSQTLTTGTRRYDPGTTRFLQQDIFKSALANLGLAADPLSQNRYALAGGNPTSFVEVDGHMAMANGGGGGSVPSNPTPTGNGDNRPGGDQPSREDVEKAEKTEKNFDWKKKLVEAGLDFIGFNDVKDCIDKPDIGSCGMAIANFLPIGKIFKAGKIAKKLVDVVGAFKDWQKARRWADDVLQRAAAGSRRADGAASKTDDMAGSCKLANSFPAGTTVRMADGSRRPIEKVKPGDTVLAADPVTGETTARTVTATIARSGDKQLTRIRLDLDGDRRTAEATLTATDGHPVWDADGRRWVDAAQLTPGDRLRTAEGRTVTVLDATTRTTRATVHNLSVADLHTYHVAAAGARTDVLVHNCPPGPSTGPGSTAGKSPAAKPAGGAARPAAREVRDDATVVRGGTTDLPPPGEVFSGSFGKNLDEAAAGVPHGQIRATTAGDIRRAGGSVDYAPEFNARVGRTNYQHVDVCLGSGTCPFGDLMPNPVPKPARFGGPDYPYADVP